MFTRKELTREKLIPCHIVSRTIGGLNIFDEQDNCLRFILQIYAANLGKPGLNLHRQNISQAAFDLLEGKDPSSELVKIEHSPLVNIISFALIKDHVHFILSGNEDNGISKFLNKLNLGFAKYFNIKNQRLGALFAKPFKIARILGDTQLNSIVWYINIKSPLEINQDFQEYKFSSFLDLFGQRQSKIIIPKLDIKHWGISLEKIEKQSAKIDLNEAIFLEKNQ